MKTNELIKSNKKSYLVGRPGHIFPEANYSGTAGLGGVFKAIKCLKVNFESKLDFSDDLALNEHSDGYPLSLREWLIKRYLIQYLKTENNTNKPLITRKNLSQL